MYRGSAQRLLLLWFALSTPAAAELRLPIPVPDLSGLEADVSQALLQIRRQSDARLAEPGLSAQQGAETLAGLGLAYQAHLILQPALACFRAAEQLDAGDYRWPYHLGHALNQAGRLDEAAQAYARSLALRPDSALVQLRLGQVSLRRGDGGTAEPLLRRAAAQSGLRAMALFELGRLQAEQNRHAQAVASFQAALQADPAADRIHYPLALSYRALGDMAAARRHLALRGPTEPALSDPLSDVLQQLSTGQRMLYNSAMEAAQRADFSAAARLFADGLETDADNIPARISLARFLYLDGDPKAAQAQLREVLKRRPDAALASLLLAALLEERGQRDASEQQYRSLLAQRPEHAAGNYLLANQLMRAGDFLAAESLYGHALETGQAPPTSWFWRILAAIRAELPADYLDRLLRQAHAQRPDDPHLNYLLAAWRSAAPQAQYRNASQALHLAEGLLKQQASPENLALLASAQAEAGDFAAAIATQERLVAFYQSGFDWHGLALAQDRLQAYKNREPNRQPWPEHLLLQAWPPLVTRELFQSYPPERPY